LKCNYDQYIFRILIPASVFIQIKTSLIIRTELIKPVQQVRNTAETGILKSGEQVLPGIKTYLLHTICHFYVEQE